MLGGNGHHYLDEEDRVVKPPTPPPIPDELTAVLRRMRLPYMRAAAPDVLATARSQRWDPAEVLRVLLEARSRRS